MLVTAFILYLATLVPTRFGAYYDDGLYVVAAKALATGQGYRTINLPEVRAQTLIPPVYPVLLSIIWRLNPQFPANLEWMMLLSVVSMVSFFALTYAYLKRNSYSSQTLSLIVVTLAAINWRTMLLAATLMSDIIYAVISIISLYLLEKHLRNEGGKLISIAAGACMGFAFLTRTAGIALILGFILYCILRREWKSVVLPLGTASIFIFAWVIWVYVRTNIGSGGNAVYYTNYVVGAKAAFANLEGINNTQFVQTVLNVLGTNLLLLVIGSIPLAALGLRYDFAPAAITMCFVLLTLALMTGGLIRHARRGLRMLHSYLFAYVLLHLLTPATGYDRYLLPILPFLLLFWITELEVMLRFLFQDTKSGRLTRLTAVFIGVVIVSYLAGAFYSNASGIYYSLAQYHKDDRIGEEKAAAIDWIKTNTSASDTIACYRDATMYLYTDRKAVLSFPLVLLGTIPYHSRQLTLDEQINAFLETVDKNNPNYLLFNSEDFKYESQGFRDAVTIVINQHPTRFVQVFRSVQGNCLIYRIQDI